MKNKVTTGYSKNGLPYMRIEGGPQNLVIFEGLNFNHKPPAGITLRWTGKIYKPFVGRYTIYNIGRRLGLTEGYSIKNMSDDYATMIENEMKTPVDLMGMSTGGTIAQQFAVDYPRLVRRLVLASTGYRLSESGAIAQRKIIDFTRRGKWRSAAATMAGVMASGMISPVLKSFFWILGRGMFGSPDDPSDGLAELEAEDRFDFKESLADIKVPTLVIGGENDRFYPVRETAAGIPSAKLVLYKNAGHMAVMKRQFNRDVLAFLTEYSI
jgi:pimeloyl-ACP methyl ester carboxylesterase